MPSSTPTIDRTTRLWLDETANRTSEVTGIKHWPEYHVNGGDLWEVWRAEGHGRKRLRERISAERAVGYLEGIADASSRLR